MGGMTWQGVGGEEWITKGVGAVGYSRGRESRSRSELRSLPAYRPGIRAGVWEVRATVPPAPLAGTLSIVSSTLGWLL